MEHVIWSARPYPNFCKLKCLNGVDNEWQIKRGIPVAPRFPKDAYFEMDERYPKDIALADTLKNLDHMAVISRRVRDFLAQKIRKDVEFLKVSIKNHKGRTEPSEYFVFSPLQIIDCIDKKASTIQWNKINPDMMSAVTNMSLVPGAIPDDLLCFRPRHLEEEVMIRADLAEELRNQKFTGLRFVPISEYGG